MKSVGLLSSSVIPSTDAMKEFLERQVESYDRDVIAICMTVGKYNTNPADEWNLAGPPKDRENFIKTLKIDNPPLDIIDLNEINATKNNFESKLKSAVEYFNKRQNSNTRHLFSVKPVILVYFGGHGFTTVDGKKTYFIPYLEKNLTGFFKVGRF